MERRRISIICLVFYLCSTTWSIVQGSIDRMSRIDYDMKRERPNPNFHSRSLSAALNIDTCDWMQDSSCQMNPHYARLFLEPPSAISNKAVVNAIVDAATCFSRTLEAACISEKKCEWVELSSGIKGNTHSYCQYKTSQWLMKICTNEGLRDFVKEHRSCRRQKGGSCSFDSHCQKVQLPNHGEVCGLMAHRALDLIIQTPASQTETISILVESAKSLLTNEIEDLDTLLQNINEISSENSGKGRKLLEESTVDNILAVNDGLKNTPSNSKSLISGTGDTQNERYGGDSDIEEGSHNKTNSDMGSMKSKEENTSGNVTNLSKSTPAGSGPTGTTNGRNGTVLAGSISFAISNSTGGTGGSTEKDVKNSSQDPENLKAHINAPLTLVGNTAYLQSVDISVSVSLHHIVSIISQLVSIINEELWENRSDPTFRDVALLLDETRFQLDSQMDAQSNQEVWIHSNKIWWNLQQAAQSLDNLSSDNVAKDKVLPNVTELLLDSCQIAKDTDSWKKNTRANFRLVVLQRRLNRMSKRNHVGETEADKNLYNEPQTIETFDDLIRHVVQDFNRTLLTLYPHQLDATFSKKYNQIWVDVLAKRNAKWHNIKTLVSGIIGFGQHVQCMIKELYNVERIHSKIEESHIVVPVLEDLTSLVDEMVGALVASQAQKYKILNLPKSLKSDGLDVWQKGPQVTADTLGASVREKARKSNLERQAKQDPLATSKDAVRKHLEAISSLIGAKIIKPQSLENSKTLTESIPENRGIMLSLETTLSLLTKWNNYLKESSLKEYYDENLYGSSLAYDLSLSFAGCMILGPDENGHCQNLENAECEQRGLYYWNVSSGFIETAEQHVVCVPKVSNQSVLQLLDHIPKEEATKLTNHVTDLFYITSYCPSLSKQQCIEDKRCEWHSRQDKSRCRPSSNVINYLVEVNNISLSAAKDQSCRTYLGLPDCMNLPTRDTCTKRKGCLWTVPEDIGEETDNLTGMGNCITDWTEQVNQVNSYVLKENRRLNNDSQECQKRKTKRSCQSYGTEETGKQTETIAHLPESSWPKPQWLIFVLTVVVTILFLMVVCISCKIYKNHKLSGKALKSKKGKRKKKLDSLHQHKNSPLPMFIHMLEMSPCESPNRKKADDVSCVMNTLDNTETSSQSSCLRVPPPQMYRMETFPSATTAEISEIQPISEADEANIVGGTFSEDNSEDSDDDWSSTAGWSEVSDNESLGHGGGCGRVIDYTSYRGASEQHQQ